MLSLENWNSSIWWIFSIKWSFLLVQLQQHWYSFLLGHSHKYSCPKHTTVLYGECPLWLELPYPQTFWLETVLGQVFWHMTRWLYSHIWPTKALSLKALPIKKGGWILSNKINSSFGPAVPDVSQAMANWEWQEDAMPSSIRACES